MTTHLSEEEFSELLIDDVGSPRARAHLDECAHCRGEIAALRRATADFNHFGDVWAQSEAASKIDAPTRRTRLSFPHVFALPLGGALAACLVVIAMLVHTGSDRLRSTGRMSAPSAAEIAQDNSWLKAMDQDLQAGPDNIAIPASELKALQRQ